jgi:hypothetical protein
MGDILLIFALDAEKLDKGLGLLHDSDRPAYYAHPIARLYHRCAAVTAGYLP